MSFIDEEFKSAIDKGTLDALLPDSEHVELAVSLLTEVWRVVKCMGCYIIISLAQDHVLSTLVQHFIDRSDLLAILDSDYFFFMAFGPVQ